MKLARNIFFWGQTRRRNEIKNQKHTYTKTKQKKNTTKKQGETIIYLLDRVSSFKERKYIQNIGLVCCYRHWCSQQTALNTSWKQATYNQEDAVVPQCLGNNQYKARAHKISQFINLHFLPQGHLAGSLVINKWVFLYSQNCDWYTLLNVIEIIVHCRLS